MVGKPIYIDLPFGSSHGWGVCGRYISMELAGLSEAYLLKGAENLSELDAIERHFFAQKLAPHGLLNDIRAGRVAQLDSPVIRSISYFFPSCAYKEWPAVRPRGTPTVGYTFFEETEFNPSYIDYMSRNWDIIVAGSRWGEEVLRQNGVKNPHSIIQGVDTHTFNTLNPDKQLFRDSFVVFSGGKFEFRKGQDIAIRAYKVLQDRHKDVLLINSWYNQWPQSLRSMETSRLIRFQLKPGKYHDLITETLAANGLDLTRVITLPLQANSAMARVYRNTDVGLFPNRCEGGTNLVLMEYMACGKPAIASYNSGHRDILTDENSLPLRHFTARNIVTPHGKAAVWEEPTLDEVVDRLEWAYNNRDQLRLIGERAGRDLAMLTWRRTAEAFLRLVEPGAGG